MPTLAELFRLPSAWQPASVVIHRTPMKIQIAGCDARISASLRIEPLHTRMVLYCEPVDADTDAISIAYLEAFLQQWGRRNGFTFSMPEPQSRMRWWGARALAQHVSLDEAIQRVDDFIESMDLTVPVDLPLAATG